MRHNEIDISHYEQVLYVELYLRTLMKSDLSFI
jgi:hypothetical protein